MKRNFKKELKETERIEDIQHANTLLVARMMSISSGDPKYRVPLYIDKTGREGSTTAGKVSFDEGESFFQTILPKTDAAQRRREKKNRSRKSSDIQAYCGYKICLQRSVC